VNTGLEAKLDDGLVGVTFQVPPLGRYLLPSEFQQRDRPARGGPTEKIVEERIQAVAWAR
jgi:hypothetical protein